MPTDYSDFSRGAQARGGAEPGDHAGGGGAAGVRGRPLRRSHTQIA